MKHKREEKKNFKFKKIMFIEGVILCILLVSYAVISLTHNNRSQNQGGTEREESKEPGQVEKEPTKVPDEQEQQIKQEEERKKQEAARNDRLQKAEKLALTYDYDKAIDLLKNSGEDYTTIPEYVAAIADFKEKKAECIPYPDSSVNHIFFHSLIADTSKAFDGDYDSNGYNYYMTTISEFKEMMQQMYDKGYVLVSIHDVAAETKTVEGKTTYLGGEMWLPPGKKPFVLSQDDVNYYDYMDGDGFATRMTVDENGRPSTEMLLEDGSTVVGDYDLVPVLETFIEEHPDFSYRGARGLIALTGYEGALGYRTDPASADSPTFEQDKETVRHIAKVMKEWGWEFACHSNGHRNMFTSTTEFVKKDTNNWLDNVGSLVGPTDVYIYPYGIEIEEGIGTYKSEKYKFLKEKGFNYYCGVFKEPWIQMKDEYVRMSRRPLDGQAMLQFPERLADLFDLSKVIDPARPALK